MYTILLYDTRQATPPPVDTVINGLLWQSAPNALLFNSATFIKSGSYSQKYYYKLKG